MNDISKTLLTFAEHILTPSSQELPKLFKAETSSSKELLTIFKAETILPCGVGIKFSIEDLEVGRFAHVAWVHSAMLEFRAVSDERSELYNRVGDAFVAIHLWSPDSPVGQQVVMPFIQQFEPMLLGNFSASGSGRGAFDPRYQSQEETEIDKMLGLDAKGSENSDQGLPVAVDFAKDQSHGQAQVATSQAASRKVSDEPVRHSRRPQRRGGERPDVQGSAGSH